MSHAVYLYMHIPVGLFNLTQNALTSSKYDKKTNKKTTTTTKKTNVEIKPYNDLYEQA